MRRIVRFLNKPPALAERVVGYLLIIAFAIILFVLM